jgi:hypothetical protein
MKLDEITKLLGVEKLDEAQQISIKEKLDTIIDVAARERADELLKEEKEILVKDFESKFEDYKGDITSKFSNFVDSVLDEELEIPEKVLKYAQKGELYDDLIEQFKIRLAIDEGVLDEEVKSLLKEAKDEILELKKQINASIAENMELKEDATEMAANLYLRKKCDGLTESQRVRIINILGDIKDKGEIDRKFKYVVEGVISEEVPPGSEVPASTNATNTNVCAQCGAIFSADGIEGTMVCPKCGAKMEDAAASVVPAENEGMGSVEVPAEGVTGNAPEPAEVEESVDPFKEQVKQWTKILRENKF